MNKIYKLSSLSVFIFAIFIYVIPVISQAACSASETRKLRDSGFSQSKITKFCADAEDEEEETPRTRRRTEDLTPNRSRNQETPNAQMTNICQTPTFWCSVNGLGRVGIPCWCNSNFGPVNGQTIPR